MSPLNSVRIHLSAAEWTFAIAAKVVPFCPLSFYRFVSVGECSFAVAQMAKFLFRR